jgi:hypothetical protein
MIKTETISANGLRITAPGKLKANEMAALRRLDALQLVR